MTPCCGDEDPNCVRWNPHNGVVQCHNCGARWLPANMGFDEYQDAALRTARTYDDPTLRLAVTALGLAGEAGETADLIKKQIGHGHAPDIGAVISELGDVAWYLAVLADCFDLSLQEVIEKNVAKLSARYPEGFSVERSVNRD